MTSLVYSSLFRILFWTIRRKFFSLSLSFVGTLRKNDYQFPSWYQSVSDEDSGYPNVTCLMSKGQDQDGVQSKHGLRLHTYSLSPR